MVYKSLLRHLCSIDTLARPGGVHTDFLLDEEDPYGPIKTSLERTIQLLQMEESLVNMFLLVKGHKKLVIQTRSHPRPLCATNTTLRDDVRSKYFRNHDCVKTATVCIQDFSLLYPDSRVYSEYFNCQIKK